MKRKNKMGGKGESTLTCPSLPGLYRSASWATRNRKCSPARALYTRSGHFITVVLSEVRVRNGPFPPEDESVSLVHFFFWGGAPQRAFCLCEILKTDIYFIRI